MKPYKVNIDRDPEEKKTNIAIGKAIIRAGKKKEEVAKKMSREEKPKYITAPSGRKFEITKSKVVGHHNINYKHK